MRPFEVQMRKFYSPELIEQMFRTKYIMKPFKEENNMDIPGKLRDDLKRIYGAADPLNYIEDARAETNPDTQQEEIVVRLRVPRHCEKYMDQLFANPFPTPAETDYIRRLVETEFYPPRFMFNKKEEMKFVKPKQVFLNGNHTTIVWPNGEKTTVGVGPDTPYDEYAGFCAAIVKKLFGSSREAVKFLDKVKVVQKKKAKKKPEMVPMPGTEDPDWGKKHWGECVSAEEVFDNV